MAETIFLQNNVFVRFLLPFLLIFFLAFAILKKTKLFGEGNGQLDALLSFVISLIFVAAFNYTTVVNNLVLFAVIGIVIVFVVLFLWTFISGEAGLGIGGKEGNQTLRIIFMIILGIAVVIGVLWAFGVPLSGVGESLFNQAWSQPFWTNLIFIILIGVALAIVLGAAKGSGGH